MTRTHRQRLIRYSLFSLGAVLCILIAVIVAHAVHTHLTFEKLKKEAARVQSVTGIVPNSFSCSTGSISPHCTANFDDMTVRHVQNMFKKSGYSFDGVTSQATIQARSDASKTRISITPLSDTSQTQRIQVQFYDSTAKT